MLVTVQLGLALGAIGAWGVFAYNWLHALRHRAPGVNLLEATTGAAHLFTTVGCQYRKRAFVAWVLGALLMLVVILLSAATQSV